MGTCRISGGGVRANVRAGASIATDRVFKYSTTIDEVITCDTAGEECDGICLAGVAESEILNQSGICHSRKDTGTYDEVTIYLAFTTGGEFQTNANGQIIAYTYNASADIRPLGRFLSSGSNGDEGKVLLYSK